MLPPVGLRTGKQLSQAADEVPLSQPGLNGEDGVYGVLYDMDPEDERVLDGYEGVDHDAPISGGDGGVPSSIRPRGQGLGAYNKWFLEARVVKWFGRAGPGAGDDTDADTSGNAEVHVLVYVDENRVVLGPPKLEYIGRMNRAMKECAELGVDEEWIEGVMRTFIPKE